MSCDLEIRSLGAGEERGRPSLARDNGSDRSPGFVSTPRPETSPRVRKRDPIARLIRGALSGALSRIRAADPEARRGQVEGIHRLRTATRRLRSELCTVGDFVDQGRREHLEGELKWLADTLGGVRDLDILRGRVRAALHECPGGRHSPGNDLDEREERLGSFLQSIAHRHDLRSRALLDALQGRRYRNLVATIEAWTVDPPLTDDAAEPCGTALPPLAAAAWKKLRKGARALTRASPEEDFHDVRKHAKRARYAAELIAPALGRRAEKKARRFIRLTTKVQDVLGEHQDAAVAAGEVERFLAERDPGGDGTARRDAIALLECQRRAAQAARRRFFDCRDRLDRKKPTRWLRGKSRSLA